MEREFVSYEIALALKELGFDEPCFAYWNIDTQLKNPAFNMVKPFNHIWCLPTPTFSQAFRWFREKYNIDCNVEPIGINKRFYSIYICFKNNNEIRGNGNLYETYEEAELECLKKLIEIVKK